MDRSILKLDELTHGCEDEDRCVRHRPLAGQAQWPLVRTFVASAAMLACIAMVPRIASHGQTVDDITMTFADQNYMTVFVPEVGSSSPDTAFFQIPRYKGYDDDPLLTWTLVVQRSGKLRLAGDEGNFYREFWSQVRMCVRDGAVMPEKREYSFPFRMAYPEYGTNDYGALHTAKDSEGRNVVWIDTIPVPEQLRWTVRIEKPGQVTFEGPVPKESQVVWRKLANDVPKCGSKPKPPRIRERDGGPRLFASNERVALRGGKE